MISRAFKDGGAPKRKGGRERAQRRTWRPGCDAFEPRVLLSVTATSLAVNATEGKAFNGNVATFVTNDPPPPNPANYSAVIVWGDGTQTPGTVQLDPLTPGVFDVVGTKTYAEEGTKVVQTLIHDSVDNTNASVSGDATIADAALTPVPVVFTAVEGTPLVGANIGRFNDANPAAPLSDFTATINWGDGSPLDTNATFTRPGGPGTTIFVLGSHTYAEEGAHPVSIVVKDVGGSTAAVASSVAVVDAALTPIPVPIGAVEGNAATGVTVGQFTDANPKAPLSDFTATINWGDGTPVDPNATITQPGGPNTAFRVTGSHTYAEEGAHTVNVAVHDVGGSNAVISSPATITDAPLEPVPVARTGFEGVALTGDVGHFRDSNLTAPLSDFTATIDWGDGTPVDPNTKIVQPGGVGNPFEVTGSHVYAEEGSYAVKITVRDIGGKTTTIDSTANIADANLSAAGTNVTAKMGVPFTNVPVATFTDANPAAPISDFSAQIDWGDKTGPSSGTITQPGGVGTPFFVSGSHTYQTNGSFPIQVTITDVAGSQAIASSTATVFRTFTVVNTHDSGDGSLRAAILNTNQFPGRDLIDFNIPGPGVQVIHLATALPPVTDPVVIDAYTQPGATPNTAGTGDNAKVLVAVDGTNAGPDTSGLVLSAGNTEVRGLGFQNFANWGVVLVGAGGDQIAGDMIGTDATGRQALGNALGGVLVESSSGNTIGGTSPADRNVISGNGSAGVHIFGTNSTGNLVQGNLVGTDATGTQALGNVNIGVLVNQSSGNIIGGLTAGAGNVISGNMKGGPPTPPTTPPEDTGAGGVVLFGAGATGNLVAGNLIGTDANGRQTLGNAYDGVSLSLAGHNVIGGVTPGAGNVISGNGFVGVRLTGPGATGNAVLGNFIGTDKSGSLALGNQADGVFLNNAPGNLIGAGLPGAGNFIGGNGGSGVNAAGSATSGNVIQGNFIGTNNASQPGLGNHADGIFLNGAPGNQVGGVTPGAGNTIGNNGFSGVELLGSGASGNLVAGNFIGTDSTGTQTLGNGAYGALIENASRNTIGGRTPGSGNLVAHNAFGGIQVVVNNFPVNGPTAGGNFIFGNRSFQNGRGNARLARSVQGSAHPQGTAAIQLAGRLPKRSGLY